MIRASFRRFSVAAFILIVAAGPAAAEPPPPAAPSPVAMPYPNTQPEAGQVAPHKHIAGVKYEDFAKSAETLEVQVQQVAWGALKDAGTVYSADPMEGGQVTARTYQPGKPTYGNVTMESVTTDSAASSARMTTSEPGKLEVPEMVAEPMAKGTATFKTLAGLCATGKHLSNVKITTRTGSSFTLHDAIVTNVIAAGDGMDEVSLTYASLGD